MTEQRCDNPLVSVVMPAHNGAGTIARALASVWRQDYRPIEVVVVDDGSQDATAAVACQHGGDTLRVVSLPAATGASNARNVGIESARGEFIAFLDCDDEWLDGKLSQQMRRMTATPAMTMIGGRVYLVPEDGSEPRLLSGDRTCAEGPDAWRTLLAYTYFSTSTVVARRSVLRALGGFNTSYPTAEDQDLFIRLALAGEVGFVSNPVVRNYESRHSLSVRCHAVESRYILEIVRTHIAANRGRLSPGEIRTILGWRLSTLGRTAWSSGQRLRGLVLLSRAALQGNLPPQAVPASLRWWPLGALLMRPGDNGRASARVPRGSR